MKRRIQNGSVSDNQVKRGVNVWQVDCAVRASRGHRHEKLDTAR